MDIVSMYESSMSRNEYSRSQQLEDITVKNNNTLEEAFPWLKKCNEAVHTAIRDTNYQNLERLIVLFTQYIRNPSKIAAKLVAALYIYLNNSEEHIFRVLIRIKHTTEKYTKICNHIFTKSFDNTVVRKSVPTPITDLVYVRYLLAFRMWKQLDKISDKKERINNTAVSLLGSRMPVLRNELLEFLPRPPAEQENETLWLLQTSLLDVKQTHKYFLQFEDRMDSLADLQSTKTIQTSQSRPQSQKHQRNSRNTSCGGNPNHKASKDCVGDNLQNHTVVPNANKNKFADQSYLQKKGTRNFKQLKKSRPKPGKTIIIDLTDDDKISVPCKIKRKKPKRNLECLKKSKQKFPKHINPLKYSSRIADGQRTGESFNKDGKSSVEKVHLECKLAPDKVRDSTADGGASINGKPSLNGIYHINLQKNEHSSMAKSQMSNTCSEFGKEDDYNSRYLKSSMLIGEDVKEFKFPTDVSKESKPETRVSSHMTYLTENTSNSYNNPLIQNKQAFVSPEENATETVPLFKMCQESIAEQPSFKQELPASMNGNMMQKSHKCCETMPVDMHDIKHLIIKELKSINDHNSQITEIIKQKECHQVNECPNCCAKIDCKPIVFINNDVTAAKAQDTLHNTLDNDNDNVKLAYDTNIIYMLSDRNKCVYVVNHIGERVMTMHAEKRVQCLEKPNDARTIPSAFAGDQIVESSLCNQHVNFNNVKDYGSAAKYLEASMKEQQALLCPHIVQCAEVPPNVFKFYKMKSYAGANPKAANDLKSFPKVEAADEITKADYVDNLEGVCFSNNIQSETLEDFVRQFSVMHQVNCDNSTGNLPIKKPLAYTDSEVGAVKAQDALHMFNDKKNDVASPRDANITYMLTDRDKCVYVANHNTNAEKRAQCLDNFNDISTVSTTLTGEQIGSSLENQYVEFSNKRKSDYENDLKYSEDMMKKQRRIDCNSSMSNDRILHLSESCTFDINSFVMDSKEANEMMKTDCIDFENIEDVLSNDTIDFLLPLKESSFELDNVYTDTFLNEEGVLCNNQNDAIDSINSIAFCLNSD